MESIYKLLEPYSLETSVEIVKNGIHNYETIKNYCDKTSDNDGSLEYGKLKREIMEMKVDYERKIREKDNELLSIRSEIIREKDAELYTIRDEMENRIRELEKEKQNVEYVSRLKIMEVENSLKQELNQLKISREMDISREINKLRDNLDKQLREKNDELKEIHRLKDSIREKFDVRENELRVDFERKLSEMHEIERKLREKLEKYEKINNNSSSKGINYEVNIVNKCMEYNSSLGSSIWNINHVGQSHSNMGDIIFTDKRTGKRILLDTKCYSSKMKQKEVDKFKFDITSRDKDTIGGILLSTSTIPNKTIFEYEWIGKRLSVYISNFDERNPTSIAWLFTILEQIMGFTKENERNIDSEMVKNTMIDTYKSMKCVIETEEKKITTMRETMNKLREEYYSIFNCDIELERINKSKPKSSETTKSNVIKLNIGGKEFISNKKKVEEYKVFYTKTEDGVSTEHVDSYTTKKSLSTRLKTLKNNEKYSNIV